MKSPHVRRRSTPFLAVALLAAALAFLPAIVTAAPPAGPRWGYTGADGPRHWGQSFPQCALGREQSPIDLAGPFEKTAAPLAIDYHPSPLRIVDNGHTIQVDVAPGSGFTIGGERYELVQFHFHQPSEETFAGQHRAMVVHLVHRSAAGKLAVIGVPIVEGAANPLVATLWAHLPRAEGQESATPTIAIDPAQLLPAERSYYRYTGSLTTPPCTEGVTFFILRHPVEMSRAQIAAFPHPGNARPVQARNGRPIAESE